MTDVGRRIVGYLIAGAIALAIVLYVSGKIDGWLGRHDAEIVAQSRAAVAIHPKLVAWRAKLRAIETTHAAAGRHALAWADSSNKALPPPATSIDSARQLVADSGRSAARSCFIALRACQQRAESAEAEADTLALQLEAQLTVRSHRCGLNLGGGPAIGAKGFDWVVTLSVGCQVVRFRWP